MLISLYIPLEILDIYLRVCRYIGFFWIQMEEYCTYNFSLHIFNFIISVEGYFPISTCKSILLFLIVVKHSSGGMHYTLSSVLWWWLWLIVLYYCNKSCNKSFYPIKFLCTMHKYFSPTFLALFYNLKYFIFCQFTAQKIAHRWFNLLFFIYEQWWIAFHMANIHIFFNSMFMPSVHFPIGLLKMHGSKYLSRPSYSTLRITSTCKILQSLQYTQPSETDLKALVRFLASLPSHC